MKKEVCSLHLVDSDKESGQALRRCSAWSSQNILEI